MKIGRYASVNEFMEGDGGKRGDRVVALLAILFLCGMLASFGLAVSDIGKWANTAKPENVLLIGENTFWVRAELRGTSGAIKDAQAFCAKRGATAVIQSLTEKEAGFWAPGSTAATFYCK